MFALALVLAIVNWYGPNAYHGHIVSSGQPCPAITQFEGSGGSYTFTYLDRVYNGKLTNCVRDRNKRRCTWNDDYGSGDVSFTFSPDENIFQGEWREPKNQKGWGWTGRRQ